VIRRAHELRDPQREPIAHRQLREVVAMSTTELACAERRETHAQSFAAALEGSFGAGEVIGESAEWAAVLDRVRQVAATETTVCLLGESGTGKEVLARLIHRASARRDRPLVAINCAALPDQLLESELFGYDRGAFTGAHFSKPGQVELAAGGVLFLDEVSEMSAPAQARFLRVLQEREFRHLGGTRVLKANIRVIAATNRDLRAAVEAGTFREDLYYRLHVFDVRLPPLRHRKGDIPLFCESFLRDIGQSLGCRPGILSAGAVAALDAYDWPGNVRELRNVLERAAILSEGGPITAEHLDLRRREAPSSVLPRDLPTDLHDLERRTIEQVLRQTRWNKAKAARQLGLTRSQLYFRLRRYGLEGLAAGEPAPHLPTRCDVRPRCEPGNHSALERPH
jgi:transcriptional regulator with GAF, ATPase, and Fis domain